MEKLGSLQRGVESRLDELARADFPRRLREKDPALWPSGVRDQIGNRLGWLTVLPRMKSEISELERFAQGAGRDGFRHALLLGMGGSSLCPDVLRSVFRPAAGSVTLHVLDSTDPEQIRAAQEAVEIPATLFVVASKSGTTVEVDAFLRYFLGRAPSRKQFVAITDEGSPLCDLARTEGFRKIFTNPADIGGRYSALSYFGLVPAALMGTDLRELLAAAESMAGACAGGDVPSENPGVRLGAVLAEAARSGRDKLTLLFSPGIRRLGDWIEQLIAESTGKEGVGIVPVLEGVAEAPDAFSEDRVFVVTELRGQDNAALASLAERVARQGHPVVRIEIQDRYALGAEFFRWEVATATAGRLLNINPFDEPNVTESKRLTAEALSEYLRTGKLPTGEPSCRTEEGAVFADAGLSFPPGAKWDGVLKAHLARRRPGDYLALLAFLPYGCHDALQNLRCALAQATGLPVTVGFGPRFLHSTGQLHKGGADNGIFVQLTRELRDDVAIPGARYSFGTLQAAQALGDFRALVGRGRRIVRFHAPGGAVHWLKILESAAREISSPAGR